MKYLIKLEESQISFDAHAELSILASSKLEHIHLEYGCQRGDCGNCKASLLSGSVKLENGEIKNSGEIFTCMSYPLSDITLSARYLPELEGIEEVNLPCKVSDIKIINQKFVVLTLRLPPQAHFKFLPGQYIDLSYQGVTRSYSIASLLSPQKTFELHIRLFEQGQFSQLLKEIEINQLMRLSGPKGTFFVRETKQKLLFLASGTGFAPIHAMMQDLIDKKDTREIFIYWRMRRGDDFYLLKPFLDNPVTDVKFIPFVSGDDPNWYGRSGHLHDILLSDFKSLTNFSCYACGSMGFIEEAKNICFSLQLNELDFYTDLFTPA